MRLVKLQKDNRQVTVEERDAHGYLMRGYNQVDDNGNVVKYALAGGTISLQQHNKVLAELDALKKQSGSSEDAAKLKLVEAELKEVKAELKAMEEDNERLSDELKKARNQQRK